MNGINHSAAYDRARARMRRLLEQAGEHEESAHLLYKAGLHDLADEALAKSSAALAKALRSGRLGERLVAAGLREMRGEV